jgi:hypothetical protein
VIDVAPKWAAGQGDVLRRGNESSLRQGRKRPQRGIQVAHDQNSAFVGNGKLG